MRWGARGVSEKAGIALQHCLFALSFPFPLRPPPFPFPGECLFWLDTMAVKGMWKKKHSFKLREAHEDGDSDDEVVEDNTGE